MGGHNFLIPIAVDTRCESDVLAGGGLGRVMGDMVDKIMS